MPTIHVIQVKRAAYDLVVVNSKGTAFVNKFRYPARPLALTDAKKLAAHISSGAHANPEHWTKIPSLDGLNVINTITLN